MYDLTCKVCESEFQSKMPHSKYCSSPCAAKAWRIRNPERCRESQRRYRDRHAERIQERSKLRYRANAEAFKQRSRNYYWRNRESALAANAEYCRINRADLRDAQRRHALLNREHIRQRQATYRANNRDRFTNYQNRRRSLNVFNVSGRDRRRIVHRYMNRCAYCGGGDGSWGKATRHSLQWDHVMPLSRGGAHSVGNLVPACRWCNQSKKDSFLAEWRYRIRESENRST